MTDESQVKLELPVLPEVSPAPSFVWREDASLVELYGKCRDDVNKDGKVDASDFLRMAGPLMHAVNTLPILGPQRKDAVLGIMRQILEDCALSEEARAQIAPVLEPAVAATVEVAVAAAKGKINVVGAGSRIVNSVLAQHDKDTVFQEVYEEVKAMVSGEGGITQANLMTFIPKVMAMLKRYKDKSGSQKREIAVGVLTKLAAEAPASSVGESAALQAVVLASAPGMVDMVFSQAPKLYRKARLCCFGRK